jgi:hypothetical protein
MKAWPPISLNQVIENGPSKTTRDVPAIVEIGREALPTLSR